MGPRLCSLYLTDCFIGISVPNVTVCRRGMSGEPWVEHRTPKALPMGFVIVAFQAGGNELAGQDEGEGEQD